MADSDDDLQELGSKLAQARHAYDEKHREKGPSSSSYGMRVGMDLVSGVAVGTGVGYALDAWLDTMPWFSLVCFCLGLAAGVRLMMETAAKAARAIEEDEKK